MKPKFSLSGDIHTREKLYNEKKKPPPLLVIYIIIYVGTKLKRHKECTKVCDGGKGVALKYEEYIQNVSKKFKVHMMV